MISRIKRKNKTGKTGLFVTGVVIAGFFSAVYFGIPSVISTKYDSASKVADIGQKNVEATSEADKDKSVKKEFVATHIKTPEAVKAIYMTSWVAGTPDFRNSLIKIADETEINAIIIDIKD